MTLENDNIQALIDWIALDNRKPIEEAFTSSNVKYLANVIAALELTADAARAEAAAMRESLTDVVALVRTIPSLNNRQYDGIGSRALKALDGTAGREFLDEMTRLREAIEWYLRPDHPIGSLAEKDSKFRENIASLGFKDR
jgi:hypothetical protein